MSAHDDDPGTVPQEEIIEWLIHTARCAEVRRSGFTGDWITPNGRYITISYFDMKPESWEFFKERVLALIYD